MPNFYSPTGNYEVWEKKPKGYFTLEEWQALNAEPIILLSLEELKEAKKAEIALARYHAEIAGVDINGITVKTDRESQALITGAVVKAMQDPTYTCNWKAEQGFIQLNATLIFGIADAVREHVQSQFEEEARLQALVDIATTATEVDAVKWGAVKENKAAVVTKKKSRT